MILREVSFGSTFHLRRKGIVGTATFLATRDGRGLTDRSNDGTFVLTFFISSQIYCQLWHHLWIFWVLALCPLPTWLVGQTILTKQAMYNYLNTSLQKIDLMKRTCHPSRRYKLSKVIHNMFYTMLGVVQFTVWEAIFVHCYATNRLPYLTDQQALSSPWNMALFLLAAFWVPLYRDGLHIYRQNVINILFVYRELHFYFAHRFIHIKAVYKYVHALHHRYKSEATINKTSTSITITITITFTRCTTIMVDYILHDVRNTDIEPFAGLSMHPVEHLYYYRLEPSTYFVNF